VRAQAMRVLRPVKRPRPVKEAITTTLPFTLAARRSQNVLYDQTQRLSLPQDFVSWIEGFFFDEINNASRTSQFIFVRFAAILFRPVFFQYRVQV
jgi:hypothetical protein